MSNIISNLFMENSQFVLIGLTGRTGSGCTSAANILESQYADIPEEHQINEFYNDVKRNILLKKF